MGNWGWIWPLLLGSIIGYLIGSIRGHGDTQAKVKALGDKVEHLITILDREFKLLAEVNEALMRGGEELAKKPGFEALDLRDWKLARRRAALRRMRHEDEDIFD